jgi:hypothetical protein
MSEHIPEPIPRDWLPEPTAPASEEVLWERRLRSLMHSADARLASLREGAPSWREILGAWWRPAAGLTVAASLALALLFGAGSTNAEPSPGDVALAAAVSGGEPAALWAALGSEADPVLAVIALGGDIR